MSENDNENVVLLDPGRIVGEAGGPMDTCSATLCIYHEDLDPELLTRRLGVAPTTSFRRGFQHPPHPRQRGPLSPPTRHGAWLLRVSEPPPKQVEDQLRRLLMLLAVEPEVWASVVAEHRVRISIGLHMSAWNRGFALSSRILGEVAKLGVELDFGIYVYYDDDES